ncbi:hypothetical protein [Massilia genomosp. 1]|uniref:Uncharacterized protein n=1 Tax=Massilia genomosp. 1 TaxID=2609280 RepID=A0ABX0MVX3_9BURK|nr:hypothetical protein [Massilia genomosp. 1]NHZ66899.1 hypothetical protein [Massilia genomosp. 1]
MNIHDIFLNAILSDAAYANNLKDDLKGPLLKAALENQMTPVLAEFISNEFTVIRHLESGDILGSGFDGTMWKNSKGKVYLSFQGTYGFKDFGADAGLAFSGVARKGPMPF